MKKVLLIWLIVHGMLFGMENNNNANGSTSPSTELYELKDADFTLWRAIERSNYNEFRGALSEGANSNYLWPEKDEEHARYADLTPPMLAVDQLCINNRWDYGTRKACELVSALASDIGKLVLQYAAARYVPQYSPYTEPVLSSRTASVLYSVFGSQNDIQSVGAHYSPARRILYQLLVRKDTKLEIERKARWDGNPVTVLTYLDTMSRSWIPQTRADGRDLSSALARKQNKIDKVEDDDDDGMRAGVDLIEFSNNPYMAVRPRNRVYYQGEW